jgi:hypothetical protein
VVERVTVVIVGRDGLTVEDAMHQVLDQFELLSRTNPAIGELIKWSLVEARMNSPFTVVAEALAIRPGVNADDAVRELASDYQRCLVEIRRGHVPEAWRAPEARKKATALLRRMHNGVAQTEVSFGDQHSPISITAADAKVAEPLLENFTVFRKNHVGSVEGYFKSVATHHHRPAIYIRRRHTSTDVLCLVSEEIRTRIVKEANFQDVWEGRRVVVRGRIAYNKKGEIDHIDAATVSLIAGRSVSTVELSDPGFTGNLTPEEYLEKFREGEIGRS